MLTSYPLDARRHADTCGGTFTCVGGRAGSKDHWQQDADLWASWGVDWVKMDWCNSQGEDVQPTYALMSKALNESGRHIHFNMCVSHTVASCVCSVWLSSACVSD
jgi:alpha-galactosidase